MSDRCPDDEDLRRLIDSSLDQETEDRLTKHLETCDSCPERLDKIAGQGKQPPSPTEILPPQGALAGVIESLHASPPKRRELGGYEIIEEVGRGGMGVVFSAVDKTLERTVAIKIATRTISVEQETDQRFLREARAIASVKHDNIVSVYSVDQADGRLFLVMELINGESLAHRLKRARKLPWNEVVKLGTQVADALAAAHDSGVCHRDIKPGNILLEQPNDRVKVTDFGLARSSHDNTLTAHGLVVGTPGYMSPEQASGQPITNTSDLFSLGVVLYEACSGISPFAAETAIAVLQRISNHHPPPLHRVNPDIPEWFSVVVQRLLSKEPRKRFSSAEELRDRLVSSCHDSPAGQRDSARLQSNALVLTAVVSAATIIGLLIANQNQDNGKVETVSKSLEMPPPVEHLTGFMIGDQHFSTLTAAIAESPSIDGVIEVLGTGPYRVDGFDLESKSITFRGSDSRPLIQMNHETTSGPLFRADNGITLRNLRIDWQRSEASSGSLQDESEHAAIESEGGNLRLFNCDLTARGGTACISSSSGSVSLEQCRLQSDDASAVVWIPSGNKLLRASDCVWMGQRNAIGIISLADQSDNAARVTLEHNLFRNRAVIQATLEQRIQRVDFTTRFNAIDSDWVLLVSRGMSFSGMPKVGDFAIIRDQFTWSDDRNGMRPGLTYLARGDFTTPCGRRFRFHWTQSSTHRLETASATITNSVQNNTVRC